MIRSLRRRTTMLRTTLCLAGVIGSLAATASVALAPARSFTPRWEVGTTWAIRTQHLHMGFRDSREPVRWSEPVTFVYAVTGKKEEGGGRTSYTVKAAPRAAGSGLATTIALVADGGRIAVAAVETHHVRHGKDVAETIRYPAASPVFTESSIIPYDAPVFPLVVPSDIQASNLLALKRKYRRVEDAGGLAFARTASQLVKTAGAVSSYVDAGGRPVDFAVPVEASRVFPVQIEDETNGQRVVQYWAEGQPWFLYSENGSSRSWLVAP
jgi:hypothetical protein